MWRPDVSSFLVFVLDFLEINKNSDGGESHLLNKVNITSFKLQRNKSLIKSEGEFSEEQGLIVCQFSVVTFDYRRLTHLNLEDRHLIPGGALWELRPTQPAVVVRSCSVSSVMSCFRERFHAGIGPSAFISALIASILG